MKLLWTTFAVLGIAAAATLSDSATQGPNPQDIATPEPEYIDIDDLPETAPAPAPAPAPKLTHLPQVFSPLPTHFQHPNQLIRTAPVAQYIPPQRSYIAPVAKYLQPQFSQELPGHYHGQSGYQYRRPVYIRRFYRRRY